MFHYAAATESNKVADWNNTAIFVFLHDTKLSASLRLLWYICQSLSLQFLLSQLHNFHNLFHSINKIMTFSVAHTITKLKDIRRWMSLTSRGSLKSSLASTTLIRLICTTVTNIYFRGNVFMKNSYVSSAHASFRNIFFIFLFTSTWILNISLWFEVLDFRE